MIWGEVLNAVRGLHLEQVDAFRIAPQMLSRDVELESAKGFPFPESTECFEEWEWISIPEALVHSLELHPVERALIEGPLLPIEGILIRDETQWQKLGDAILNLEKEWLEKSVPASERTTDRMAQVEASLKARWLKLLPRTGLKRLKAV